MMELLNNNLSGDDIDETNPVVSLKDLTFNIILNNSKTSNRKGMIDLASDLFEEAKKWNIVTTVNECHKGLMMYDLVKSTKSISNLTTNENSPNG